MRDHGLNTDQASRYKIYDIPPHPQPPKLALYECERAVVTRVAGESGGMAPLEYLSPGLPRNELSPIWTSTGGRLGTSSFPNLLLDIHPGGTHEHFRAQDGLRRLHPVLGHLA